MDSDNWGFFKFAAAMGSMMLIGSLLFFSGLKAIDYHFPSKFDKLIHCKKDN